MFYSYFILLFLLLLSISDTYIYYNFRLGLGCNLGKDLSWDVEIGQLVKYKNIGLVSTTIYLKTIRITYVTDKAIKS